MRITFCTNNLFLIAGSEGGQGRWQALKTHEKTNKCNLCDFASSYANKLRRHLKTHGGEKTKKCNLCDYASSQAGNLRRHLKIHSGEKINKCNLCDYAFSDASSEAFENPQWRKDKQMQPM